jgi:hypothetical protein
MPESLGFQVEEERGPDQTIARSSVARTAFVGRTLRGPVNRAVTLHSYAQFQQTFGGLWQPSTLSYAVEQFFDNGGREAVVVRVVNGARAATLRLTAGADTLHLRAVRPGTREFLRASVDYDNIPPTNTVEFNLTVQRVRTQGTALVEDQEIYPRLSILPCGERYIGHVLAESQLVRLDGEPFSQRPDATLNSASGIATRYVACDAGDDGDALTDYDIIGSERERTGLFALGVDCFNLLCIPPLTREQDLGPVTLLVAARFCKERRALFVVDPPSEWHTADDALRGLRQWPLASDNALMYFPRILAHDKLRGHFEAFAPCGAVAGMLAKYDEGFPVWGPEKLEDAILRPGFRPVCLIAEDRRMRLAAKGVNTIQAVRSAARIGVSPRTLAAGTAGSADWQSLALRRLALFILNSIERGTRWIVHSKPHLAVAALAAAQVSAFFERLHESGAFGDRAAAHAYFVVCDERDNSNASNEFQFVIGFAAGGAREFHCFRIVHSVAGSKVTPCANPLNATDYSPEELAWVDKLASQLRR